MKPHIYSLAAMALLSSSAIAHTPIVEPEVRPNPDCVILLHGLTRSPKSMKKLSKFLTDEGYSVVNQGYPSREKTVGELAHPTIESALIACGPDSTVHFVTHSLGGILVRQYLANHDVPQLGRVVMMGPPNQGSEIPDKVGDWPGYEWLNGPVGLQLGTDENSVPNTLGPADFDVGVIAGTKSINLILSTMIPETDDGKVSVENTKLDGMNDHITLPVSHPFLMRDKDTLNQVAYYLEHGKFDHGPEKAALVKSDESN